MNHLKKCSHVMLFLLVIVGWSTPSLAGLNLELAGSGSQSNAGLTQQKDSSGSVSVGMDMGTHFQIGLSHRESIRDQSGLREIINGTTASYEAFASRTHAIINSVNFTIILYNGVISPYVFGGIARHQYNTEIMTLTTESQDKFTIPMVPNYGFGFAIYLNENFSLKITQTFSPGIKTTLDTTGQKVDKIVKDSYLDIGIRYKM